MKILLVNNYFYLRGGAEKVFFDEAELLCANGHDVSYFSTQSVNNQPSKYSHYFSSELSLTPKNIGRFIYSRESRRNIRELIQEEKPDIAHLHNIYQDISPSILFELRKQNIPVIITLHDYKLMCPNYTMINNGQVCEDCKGGNYYYAVMNRCKQGSLLNSAVLSLEAYIHKWMKIWEANITTFITPSLFMKRKMVEFGWDERRIEVVGNFLDLDNYKPRPECGEYLLYIGRLSGEKGISTLLAAFKSLDEDIKLVIAGGGALESRLKEESWNDARIHFAGNLSGNKLTGIIQNARCVVVPSEWYENAPISILEALACAKPVLGAKIGGVPEMIIENETGFLFESGSVEDLRDKIRRIMNMSAETIKVMGMNSRKYVESKYSAQMHYEGIMHLYNKATTGQHANS